MESVEARSFLVVLLQTPTSNATSTDNGQLLLQMESERVIGTRKFSLQVNSGEYYFGVRNLEECTIKTPNKKLDCHLLIEYPDGSSEERVSSTLKSTCVLVVVVTGSLATFMHSHLLHSAPEPWKERVFIPTDTARVTLSVVAPRSAVCGD